MSTYTSFAIIGAGGLGKHIVDAFVASKAKFIVLSRSGSSKELPGVKVVSVDYTDKSAVAAVLKENGVDVVVSAVGQEGLVGQIGLADAAKAAGVKLFVPSEYGIVPIGLPWPKEEVAKHLEKISLPSLRVFSGLFVEYAAFLIGLGPEGKSTIIGKGDTPISLTSLSDVGGFLAHILTTLPPSELENRLIRIQGDRLTLNEIAKLYKVTPEQLDVASVPKDNALEGFRVLLLERAEKGAVSTGWDPVSGKDKPEDAGSSNALWPGHHWVTVKELHKL